LPPLPTLSGLRRARAFRQLRPRRAMPRLHGFLPRRMLFCTPLALHLGWSGCGVVCIEPLLSLWTCYLCLAALMPPILRGWAFCLTARLAFELLVSRLLSFPLWVVCIAPLCRSASVGSLLPVPGYVWFFAVGLASSLRRLPSYSATAFGPPAIDCGPCHEVWPSGPSCSGSCRQLLHLNCPSARRG